MPKLEEVFKKSGTPTITFVEPKEYQRLRVGLRTPGRGLIIEGPSGIGKTTAVKRAIADAGLEDRAQILSARNAGERELIALLPSTRAPGLVIVDDFHRLDDSTKRGLADYAKALADSEDPISKLVLVGINRSGATLVNMAPDITDRIERIRFGTNEDGQILELISRGATALNVEFDAPHALVDEASGSFNLAQVLCHEACLHANVDETQADRTPLRASIDVIREHTLANLYDRFWPILREFAQGHRVRRSGRAPYLTLLYWLSKQDEWVLDIEEALRNNPDHRLSVGQVVEKGYLAQLLREKSDLGDALHYDATTGMLATEDPKFFYFIKRQMWSKIPRQLGYLSPFMFKARYDFALSFAGADRDIASLINDALLENEVAVFYDANEQHRIAAENIEDYLGPIYRSEAQFVVPIVSASYPRRIWTKFESDQFRHRFGEGCVVPIVMAGTTIGLFDLTSERGYLTLDRSHDLREQANAIALTLCKKLDERRAQEQATENGEDA